MSEVEVEQISLEDARDLTNRIRRAVEITWDLVTRAYTSRAWAALGYESWDEYCAEEFATSRLRLPREERKDVVGSLREAGLSTRAIAAVTGVDQSTISRDLSAGDANASPGHTADPTPAPSVTGTDGRVYPAKPDPVARNLGVGEYWEPEENRNQAEHVRDRKPRTDVVGNMASLLHKIEDAAELAQTINSAHLKNRSEEASRWAARIATATESINALKALLEEAAE